MAPLRGSRRPRVRLRSFPTPELLTTRPERSVLGDEHTDGDAVVKPGLPGRFFSITVPNRGRIELVGYDATGRTRAHIGNRARPDRPAQSNDEAQAQGGLAGFAAAVAAPSTFTYEGRLISPKQAADRGLVCAQDRSGVRCYDSLDALDKAQNNG